MSFTILNRRVILSRSGLTIERHVHRDASGVNVVVSRTYSLIKL